MSGYVCILSCQGLLTARRFSLCMVAGVSASERKGKKKKRNEGNRKRVGQEKYCAYGSVENVEIKDTDAG